MKLEVSVRYQKKNYAIVIAVFYQEARFRHCFFVFYRVKAISLDGFKKNRLGENG